MTTKTTKEDVLAVLEKLKALYSGQVWYLGETESSDEGGPHLNIFITSRQEAAESGFIIPSCVDGVKVCSVRKNERSCASP